jgi:hypothetical protein
VLKARHAALIADASRGACFCVVLLGVVAAALGLNIKRNNTESAQRVSRKDLLFITLQLARRGFSPKASLHGIPEWITVFNGVASFIAHMRNQPLFGRRQAKKLRSGVPSAMKLRKQCRKFGMNPAPIVNGRQVMYSRAKMVRMLVAAQHPLH